MNHSLRVNYYILMTVMYHLIGFLQNDYFIFGNKSAYIKYCIPNKLNKWNISEHNHTWSHTISTLWHMWHMRHICYICFSIVNKLFKSLKMPTVQSRESFRNVPTCTNAAFDERKRWRNPKREPTVNGDPTPWTEIGR